MPEAPEKHTVWDIFCGPSLLTADRNWLAEVVSDRIDIVWHSPACRGDLTTAREAKDSTNSFLIIDGEFGQSLSISVSEIRDALEAGATVVGASSMGALRAVECRTIGMRGIGWVYQQYLAGVTEADSDVALIYHDETQVPLTIPQINVRWLLHLMRREIEDTDLLQALYTASNEMYYADRTPRALMREWRNIAPAREYELLLSRFKSLELRKIWDRKRLDAIQSILMLGGCYS